MEMKQPDIEIQIDELVLHGFPPMNNRRMKEVVEAQLSLLVRNGDMHQSLRVDSSIDQSPAVTMTIRPHATAAAIGKQIARSIYRGMKT
jgi:hypothetical protein